MEETVKFSHLKACPHKLVSVEDKTKLMKVYQRTSNYIVHDKETTIAENDVYLQSFFTGDRSPLGIICVELVDLPPNKKWKSTIYDDDANFITSALKHSHTVEDEGLQLDTVAFWKGR